MRLWDQVDELVSPERSLADLRAHRLQLLAASYWRRIGVPVPDDLLLEERDFGLRSLAAAAVLRLVRRAVTGPIIVFKGPEVAAHYAVPAGRPFGDLDLLVPDPVVAHGLLLLAGFVGSRNSEDYYDGLQHVQPLRWPTLPLSVELHHHPNWVEWARPPSTAQLFEDAVPARVGQGISALDPAKHALVLAVNSWTDEPLRCVLDLVDIVAVLGSLELAAVQPLADDWGVGGIWKATSHAVNHMLFGAPRPASMRIWGRAAASVRDVTVAENHVRRLASVFWALPPHRAVIVFARALAGELLPSDDERWALKVGRAFVALRNAFRRRTHHHRVLGDDAHRYPRRSRRQSIARARDPNS